VGLVDIVFNLKSLGCWNTEKVMIFPEVENVSETRRKYFQILQTPVGVGE